MFCLDSEVLYIQNSLPENKPTRLPDGEITFASKRFLSHRGPSRWSRLVWGFSFRSCKYRNLFLLVTVCWGTWAGWDGPAMLGGGLGGGLSSAGILEVALSNINLGILNGLPSKGVIKVLHSRKKMCLPFFELAPATFQ